jgi:hypothetical protein
MSKLLVISDKLTGIAPVVTVLIQNKDKLPTLTFAPQK